MTRAQLRELWLAAYTYDPRLDLDEVAHALEIALDIVDKASEGYETPHDYTMVVDEIAELREYLRRATEEENEARLDRADAETRLNDARIELDATRDDLHAMIDRLHDVERQLWRAEERLATAGLLTGEVGS